MPKKTEETQIKKSIKDFLMIQGWFVYHNLNAGIGVKRGLSDLTALKNGITLWIEVKSQKGKQSIHQREFQEDIVDHGGFYLCVSSAREVNEFIKYNLWATSIEF